MDKYKPPSRMQFQLISMLIKQVYMYAASDLKCKIYLNISSYWASNTLRIVDIHSLHTLVKFQPFFLMQNNETKINHMLGLFPPLM